VSAALNLRAAVHARLTGDAVLGGVLGGAKVYDEVPGAAVPPYVVLSQMTTKNRGTVDEPAEEHQLTLEVWSRQGGLAEVLSAADAVIATLGAALPAVDGYRLANFTWLQTDARRSSNGRYRSAALKFRALTEPA
jgi:hypothetical protein